MFPNKFYERDIKYTFEMNRFFSYLVGIWPFARKNSFFPETVESISIAIACFILLLSEIIPSLLYVFVVLKDIRMRLKVVGSVIFSIVTVIKYGYIVLYKSQVKNCLMLVNEDWQNVVNPSVRISMIEKVRFSRHLIVVCSLFIYMSGMFVRMIIPLSKGKIVTPQNITIRPLPIVAHFVIFDVQRSPAYEIVFLVQLFAGFIKYTVTVAIFSFVTLCVMHFCAQLDIMVTLMNNFVNEHRLEDINKKLAIVVEHQIKTRNFLQLVQNVTQYPNLIEVLGSSVMLCFAGYYIIMEWEDYNAVGLCSYVLVLTMFCFNVFIYCYMGEQVIEQGDKIALTACTLEWYRLPDVKARALLLIISISETPLKLKAGNFFDLSLRTFGNVIKMAMTYFNLLRPSG